MRKAAELMNGTLSDRSDEELSALNVGSPYALDVVSNSKNRCEVIARIRAIDTELKDLDSKSSKYEALIKERRKLSMDLAKFAYLMQSANGDMAISIFKAGAIDHGNRVNYFEKYKDEYNLKSDADWQRFLKDNNIESINPDNKYVPVQPKSELDSIVLGAGIALPIGTIFVNAKARDNAKYVVKQVNGKLAIAREDGKKIVMDGQTSKNGVMILKKLRKIAFKGSQGFYNNQYNIMSSNSYSKIRNAEQGKNLSLVSKA